MPRSKSRSKSRSKRDRCGQDPCAAAEQMGANPDVYGPGLQVLFETLVQCKELPEGVNILRKSSGPPMIAKCLLDALLDTPIQTPPTHGADFAEACARISQWNDEDACNYFCTRVRHAMLEYLGECASTMEEIRSKDPISREQRGVAVVGVHFQPGLKGGELSVLGGGQAHGDSFRRGLVPGYSVGISGYGSNSLHRDLLIEAAVVNEWPLVLKLAGNKGSMPGLIGEAGLFRVDRIANRQQFERILRALFVLCAPDREVGGRKKPSPAVARTVLAKGCEAASHAESGCNYIGSGRPNTPKGMNESQARAIANVDSQVVTLVQGPPGTGKTFLAVHILHQWSKASFRGPVLATSDSNIAVDNIVEGLVRLGVKVVRMGRPDVARATLLDYCIDEIACKVLGVKRLQDCTDGQRRHDAIKDIMKGASVIACTAIGAGSGVLERARFARVLVDEASQATELATIVPICLGCEQAVLLGDHCQLPPTVCSEIASAEGLNISLFERLVRTGLKAHLLEMQYRMNSAISSFPAQHFYAGRLFDGIQNEHRPPLEGFSWPCSSFPVALVGMAGRMLEEGTSFSNHTEAAEVVRIVLALLRANNPSDIGVVTPYSAQVRLIRTLLRHAGVTVGSHRDSVEVASVDGFQGREKEGIVMSTVRSSSWGGIGFVSDWRRANVAFTRARRGLIVVADPSTLAREKGTWLPWLHWVRGQQCYVGVSLDHLPEANGHALIPVGLATFEPTTSATSSLPGPQAADSSRPNADEPAGDTTLKVEQEIAPQDAWPAWEDVAFMVSSDNQTMQGTELKGPTQCQKLLQPGVQDAPSADYDAKVASRDYGSESKDQRAKAREHEAAMRRQARGANTVAAAAAVHSETHSGAPSASSPRAAITATVSPEAVVQASAAGSASVLMPVSCFQCFITDAASPFPPAVSADCIVFGSCEYEFDGTPYGDEYLVLVHGEMVVYLNQEDQCWLWGRRAVWKNESLHHPIDDGRLFQGWFPPSSVEKWTLWRPEPDHTVRSLRGFFA